MTSETTSEVPAVECSVRVARAALTDALRPVRRAVKQKHWEEPAVVSMEGENLKIAFVGGAVSVPAEGRWAGEVRVPTLLFARLARNLPTGIPAGDPLPVELRDDRLYVGSAWAKCVRQAAFHSEIELPLDPDLVTLLRLQLRYPTERLERAGVLARVKEARMEADRLIRQAAAILAPLGVPSADVYKLVLDRLRAEPGE